MYSTKMENQFVTSSTGGDFLRYDIIRDGQYVASVPDKADAEFIYSHLADGGKPWTEIELKEIRKFDSPYREEAITIEKRWRE